MWLGAPEGVPPQHGVLAIATLGTVPLPVHEFCLAWERRRRAALCREKAARPGTTETVEKPPEQERR